MSRSFRTAAAAGTALQALRRFVNHPSRPLLFLLLTGAAVRLLVLLGANGIVWPDSLGYYHDAKSVLAGRICESHLIFRTPLFPAFWAAFLALGDVPSSGLLMIATQHLLGLMSVLLVYRLVRELVDPATAFAAALLFSFHTLQLYYESVVLTENLFVFLLCASAYVFNRALQDHRLCRWLECGALFALLTLARPIGQLLLPALLPLVWIKHRSLPRLATAAAVSLATLFLVLCPWMACNLKTFGFFGVARLQGVQLFHKAFDKAWLPPPPQTRFPDVRRAFDAQRALQDERRIRIDWSVFGQLQKGEHDLSPVEADRRMLGFTIEAIRLRPLDFIADTATDFRLFFWRAKPSIHVQSSEEHGPYLSSRFNRRIATPAFPRRPVERCRPVRELLAPYFRHGHIPMPLIVLLAVAGAALFTWRRKDRQAEGLIFAMIPLYLAFFTVVLETYQDRYRLPADPFLFTLAAFAVLEPLRALLRRFERPAP